MPPRGLKSAPTVFRTVRVAALTAQGHDVAAQGEVGPRCTSDDDRGVLKLGARQREALLILRGVPQGLPAPELAARGVSSSVLSRLSSMGLVSVRQEAVDRDPFAGSGVVLGGVTHDPARELTDEQREALAALTAQAEVAGFQVTLLHGVTGSGKTELYLRLAAHVRAAERGVLLLVPEIALTPAVAALFRSRFGASVAIQHSGLSDGERHDQWHRIRLGQVDIVVGTRSAVFAPMRNLGLIIVDEEHDTSYKQEENPRYHGRDVAVMRGKIEGALVVLGSATPSMESYQNAKIGRYARVSLERRVLDRPLARVSVVDMKAEYAERGPDVVISSALGEALAGRMEKAEQALVLLNRRGYASAVFCRQCGGSMDCPNCSVSLTVHTARQDWRARCHYCNYTRLVPKACPACAGPYMEHIGFGTERVEAELRRLLPEARVARIDRDSIRRKGSLTELLGRFARRELDVLVGTQMIAKGHDFPEVTLVGVISADVGLGLADFRAAERTFQLLTQVAGRAGRGEQQGEAIIQTIYPDHYSIRLACVQEYAGFFEREIDFRMAMRYPPLVAMVNVLTRGPSLESAMETAGELARRSARARTAASWCWAPPSRR
jgi:primosomal protein N' (replication factor Y) (superfamily II helicase)